MEFIVKLGSETISTQTCATEGCENRVPRDPIAPGICAECRERLLEEAAITEKQADKPDGWDDLDEPTAHYTQLLCQCGWGSLKIKIEDIPECCPLCGYCFEPDDAF